MIRFPLLILPHHTKERHPQPSFNVILKAAPERSSRCGMFRISTSI